MRTILLAVVVGLLLGGLAFFLLSDRAPSGGALNAPAATTAPPGSAPLEEDSARVWASPARPGLVALVVRHGTAAPGARVELFAWRSGASSTWAWTSLAVESTDATGRAAFPADAGRYALVATVADGSRASALVELPRAPAPTEVRVELAEATASLAGRVVDAAGRPIPSALVEVAPALELEEVLPAAAATRTTADTLGRFSLTVPREAAWRVVARAPGFVPGELSLTRVELVAIGELVLRLAAAATVDGLVVDERGQPVESATIRARAERSTREWGRADAGAPLPRASDDALPEVLTGAQGAFRLAVPPGALSLHATAPDGRQALARVTAAPTGATRVTLTLSGGHLLSGSVRDGAGPLAGVAIAVQAEPELLVVARLDSDAQGRFEARALPAGRYTVAAAVGAGRRATQVGVELPGAGAVDLVLERAAAVQGVVEDGAGQPVEAALVRLAFAHGLNEPARLARTGADGRFEFDDLLPSTVTLLARHTEVVSETVERYLAAGEPVEVTLRVNAEGELAGQVVLSEPRRLRVMLQNNHRDGDYTRLETDADGRFRKRLAAGDWRVFVQHGSMLQSAGGVTIRPGEVTEAVFAGPPPDDGGAFPLSPRQLHTELGSGLSFENSPGGVRISFLMHDSPAAEAGARLGDLVLAIDQQPVRDALDAFARVRRPRGAQVVLLVRRDGADLTLPLE